MGNGQQQTWLGEAMPVHETGEGAAAEIEYGYFDPDLAQEPYSFYAKARSQCPVFHTQDLGGYWVATSYDVVSEMNRDWQRYSSARNGIMIPPFGRLPMIEMDPPDHADYRRMLNPFFAPQRIAELEDSVRATADELIDRFAGSGKADLTKEYTKPLPGIVLFAHVLGMPRSDLDYIQQLVDEGLESYTDVERRAIAVEKRERYFIEFLEARSKDEPRSDVVDLLLAAEVGGKKLTFKEMVRVIRLLTLAGLETTASGLSSSLYFLTQHPDVRAHLIAHPEDVASAVEEWLRYFSPVQGLGRTVNGTVQVAGQTLHDGERLLLCWASANRDEKEFPGADEWILGRAPNRHIAFGVGFHRCLGSHLARLELRVGVEQILSRLGDFEVAGEIRWTSGPSRGVSTLPVRFSPR